MAIPPEKSRLECGDAQHAVNDDLHEGPTCVMRAPGAGGTIVRGRQYGCRCSNEQLGEIIIIRNYRFLNRRFFGTTTSRLQASGPPSPTGRHSAERLKSGTYRYSKSFNFQCFLTLFTTVTV